MIKILLFITIILVIIVYLSILPVSFNKKTKKSVWKTNLTYYPFVPVGSKDGNVYHNLWAKNGCLEKFDLWMKNKFNIDSKAQEYEKQPFYNWLIDKPYGYYVPSIVISSKNFEKTSGVNINQDGVLNDDIKYKLENLGLLNKDYIESWWWGSCELVSRANLFFNEPTKSFIDGNILFTPDDIKGLLTIISRTVEDEYEKISDKYSEKYDIIVLKDGTRKTGKIINLDINSINNKNKLIIHDTYLVKNLDNDIKFYEKGEIVNINKNNIKFIKHETKNDVNAGKFHNTIMKWTKDNLPFAMDTDKGGEVWHYAFDKVEINEVDYKNKKDFDLYQKLRKKYNLFYKIHIINCVCYKSNDESERYKYYIVYNPYRKIVDSNWLSLNKPDFVWRCKLKKNWESIKENHRNPYVVPYYVSMLYKLSI